LEFGVHHGQGRRVGGVILLLDPSLNWCGGLYKIWWRLVWQFLCERGTKVHKVSFKYIDYKISCASGFNFILILANWALALPGKNLMSLGYPSGHFTLHKVFSPVIPIWVLELGVPQGPGVGLEGSCLC